MKIKKLLSAALAGIMVLGTVSFSAFAEDGDTSSTTVAKINTTEYSTLKEAIAAANDNDTITIIGKIEVKNEDFGTDSNSPEKSLTFAGENSEGVIDDELDFTTPMSGDNPGCYAHNMNLTFKNLKLTLGNADYHGFKHSYKGIFENCEINGKLTLFAPENSFKDCKFVNPATAYAQNMWTYASNKTTFEDCTFDCYDRSINVYTEGNADGYANKTAKEISFSNCTFRAQANGGKAAIEIDSSNVPAKITFNNTTVESGFADGQFSGNTLYNFKGMYPKASEDPTSVTQDDSTVDLSSVREAYFTSKKYVSKIGNDYYTTLKAAIEAANDGETVELLEDANGDGIVINSTSKPISDLTVDFGGHTYTVDGMLVGSATSETNGFQLLAQTDASGKYVAPNITFKNGTICSSKKAQWGLTTQYRDINHGVMMLIQNYSNLTLEDITLNGYEETGSGFNPQYVLSNNNGHTVITGNTNIIAASNYKAFDVCAYSPYPSVSVTLDENMTGTIKGNIEFSNSRKVAGSKDDFNIVIKNGTVIGNFKDLRTAEQKNVEFGDITGGSFTVDVSKYCGNGYTAKQDANGNWVVDESASKVTVGFKPVLNSDGRKYNIVVTAKDANEINKLNTADLTFKLTPSNAADSDVVYTITPAEKISVECDETNADRYVFYFNGKDDVTTDTGSEVVIGTVEFEGYTKNNATVSFETVIANSLITATTKTDNLVIYFGSDADGLSAGDNITDKSFAVPTKKLTVNINFPQKIVNTNDKAYQAMSVTISGADFKKTIDLGNERGAVSGGNYSVSEYLPQNTAYTVVVSGDGYRTARYTVNLTDNKILTFWNNVMTTEVNVEEGNDNSARKITFLAGDIVKDNKINIYDLSAVVSYLGTKIENRAEKSDFAKYDLNRDGVIDSKDIAYVLVSWGY